MIKTVKVKKRLRLDELIKYVRENQIGGGNYKEYFSDCMVYSLCINGYKLDYFLKDKTVGLQSGKYPNMPLDTTFTVEVEEEITEDTVFIWLVEASDERIWNQKNASISDVIDERTNEIRALINGKLELIYERNEESINA